MMKKINKIKFLNGKYWDPNSIMEDNQISGTPLLVFFQAEQGFKTSNNVSQDTALWGLQTPVISKKNFNRDNFF